MTLQAESDCAGMVDEDRSETPVWNYTARLIASRGPMYYTGLKIANVTLSSIAQLRRESLYCSGFHSSQGAIAASCTLTSTLVWKDVRNYSKRGIA